MEPEENSQVTVTFVVNSRDLRSSMPSWTRTKEIVSKAVYCHTVVMLPAAVFAFFSYVVVRAIENHGCYGAATVLDVHSRTIINGLLCGVRVYFYPLSRWIKKWGV